MEQNTFVGEVMTPTRVVTPESSLLYTAEVLRDSSLDAVPVVSNGYLMGVVWAGDVRQALLNGEAESLPVGSYMDRAAKYLLPNTPIAQAHALFKQTGLSAIPIADEELRYLGMLSPLSLVAPRKAHVNTGVIGGLATPLGVYLTNGVVRAGASHSALFLTGVMLFGLFITGVLFAMSVVWIVGLIQNEPALQLMEIGRARPWSAIVMQYVPPFVFLFLVRALPISGTHAAEHMVVHAIERKETLTYDVVKHMPRVHPRCGTNIAVGLMLFLWIAGWDWKGFRELGALVALVVTLIWWKRLGNLVQFLITTKPPSRKQLESAIKVGHEFLEKCKTTTRTAPSFGTRLLSSGLPYVLAGSIIASSIFVLITVLLDIPFPLR